MHQLVTLKIGEGSVDRGFPVIAQIGPDGAPPETETAGRLDPCPELLHLYTQWQTAYRSFRSGFRLEMIAQPIQILSFSEESQRSATELQEKLNLWLQTESFRSVRELLYLRLMPSDQIRVILQSENSFLRRLPWHLWDWFDKYPRAELALSNPIYQGISAQKPANSRVKILAILGNSQGINIEEDRLTLEGLSHATVTFLSEPRRQTLTDQLWDQHWDILFFAGHSSSFDSARAGRIAINQEESLSISQLRYALKKAVFNGLKLAIFNSCDGLGLAHELSDLHIPQIIVMREPIPDPVAQEFLKHFLIRFVAEDSLYLAVREARERLQGMEDQFPFATWLPVICQNPAERPPTWADLWHGSRSDHAKVEGSSSSSQMVTMIFVDVESSTAMKSELQGKDLRERNQLYFTTILQPHRKKVNSLLSAYSGRLIQTEGDGHFVVFQDISQAVQWAVALQVSHVQDPINTPLGPLKLRIGMHTGSPVSDGSDYVGQEIDCASRISGLACGGQILVSEVTAVLARHAGVEGLSFHNHGEHPLRGIGSLPVFEVLYGERQPHPLRNSVDRSKTDRAPQSPDRLKRLPLTTLIPMVVFCIVMGGRWLGVLQPLEVWGLDFYTRLGPQEDPDPRLLIISITEEDIKAQADENRRGSLSDKSLNQLLSLLEKMRPRVMGLDIYRDFPVSSDYPELARQLSENENLVMVCKARDAELDSPGISPPPEVPPSQIGFSDFIPDLDGILRRQILFMDQDPVSPCPAPYSLSSQLAFRFLLEEGVSPEFPSEGTFKLGELTLQPIQSHFGGYQSVDSRGAQILLNYRSLPSPDQIAARATLTDVLNGNLNPEAVKDRVVLIGVTAASAGDYWSTPFGVGPADQVAGVYVQAQMVSHLISAVIDGRPLRWVWPQWGEGIWILVWSLVGGVWVGRVYRGSRQMAYYGVMMIILTGICWVAFLRGGWLPWIPSIMTLSFSSVTSLAVNLHLRLSKSPEGS